MPEQKQAQIMQINLKNGVNVQIGVKDFEEFKTKKEMLLKSGKEFIELIDTCTIRKSEVALIEYYVVTEQQITKKGGKNKWQRK